MANYRQIHVSIWKDEWFLDLEPKAKLLFIYLFSNEATSLSGLYKLPLKVIEFETGLDRQYIIDTLSNFSEKDKVHYQDGLVWVVHMRKYHETKSALVQKRITSDIHMIPDCELKIRYLYGMDTETQLKEEEKENKEEKEEEYKGDKIGIIVPLMEEFTRQTNITELNFSRNDFSALSDMQKAGVTPDDLRNAVQILRDKDYSISGPSSVQRTAISEMSKRTRNGKAPPGGIGKPIQISGPGVAS